MRRLSLIILAGLILALSVQPAFAAFWTTTADVLANDPYPLPVIGPPLTLVELIATNGKTYVNKYAELAIGAPPPFLPNTGLQQRAIIAAEITNLNNGVNYSPIAGPGASASSLVLIAGLDGIGANPPFAPGTIDFTPGLTLGGVTALGGRAAIINPAATFIGNDPTTWIADTVGVGGVPGADGVIDMWDVAAVTVAEYVMKPKEGIVKNNGTDVGVGTPAAVMNTASVDIVNAPSETEGRWVFREDYANALLPDQPGNAPGDGFLTTTPNLATLPYPPKPLDAIYAETKLTIEAEDPQLDPTWIPGPAGDDAVLNAIGAWAGFPSVGGAAGNGFANFGAGTVDDWLFGLGPVTPGSIAVLGDFRSQGDLTLAPGVQIIPEVSSFVTWSLLLTAAAGFYRRRRKA